MTKCKLEIRPWVINSRFDDLARIGFNEFEGLESNGEIEKSDQYFLVEYINSSNT